MRARLPILLLPMLILLACVRVDRPSEATQILAIGDSILSFHGLSGASAPDIAARQLGRPLANLSEPGARLTYPARDSDVFRQYRPGNWDWVILNGGANDLLRECGCNRCEADLDRLIGQDGTAGEFSDLVSRIRRDGARVMLLGYYFSDRNTVFSVCTDELRVLNARLKALAAGRAGVHYTAASDVIDPRSAADFFIDGIHPSRTGAQKIGAALALQMQAAE